MSNERRFFNGLMFFMGGLAGVLLGALVIGAFTIAGRHPVPHGEDSEALAALEARISPVGRVVLQGQASEAVQVTVAPTPVATELTGAQAYNQACFVCHTPPGIGGAPALGDMAAWEGRIAQGVEVMYEHALQGFQGQTGFMPAKGGRLDLSDQAVREAVDFMLEELEN